MSMTAALCRQAEARAFHTRDASSELPLGCIERQGIVHGRGGKVEVEVGRCGELWCINIVVI